MTRPGTHVVVEVFYGGEWHLYDPTFGVKFLRKDGHVASYRDVRLDTSLIREDLFSRFDPRFRREVLALLLGSYKPAGIITTTSKAIDEKMRGRTQRSGNQASWIWSSALLFED